ncbi:MAG TPA: hypothetical protein DDY86_10330, partial [Syntrophaceae bacterium]|nr:hypothetical protein [Syntrophaceae bacterium]
DSTCMNFQRDYLQYTPGKFSGILLLAGACAMLGYCAMARADGGPLPEVDAPDRLSIHGYADFQYGGDSRDEGGSFIQNELSIFLRATTRDERWTVFSEIEFDRIDGDGFLTDRGGKSVELEVETAWAEYRHNDLLRLRAGKLLLPQYWQTYHYPNLTMSTLAPLMSGNVFPKSILALQASGDWWNADDRGVSYAVFAGHGGDTARVELEQNDNIAAGGRLTLRLAGSNKPAWLDTLDLSISGLAGRDDDGKGELILGLDAQIRLGRLEILSELARGSRPRHRGDLLARLQGASGDTLGFYLQAAYRVAPKWHVFYRFDHLDLNDEARSPRDESRHTFGVNFRPRPKVSLKLEVFQSDPEGGREDYAGLGGSVVFNF